MHRSALETIIFSRASIGLFLRALNTPKSISSLSMSAQVSLEPKPVPHRQELTNSLHRCRQCRWIYVSVSHTPCLLEVFRNGAVRKLSISLLGHLLPFFFCRDVHMAFGGKSFTDIYAETIVIFVVVLVNSFWADSA